MSGGGQTGEVATGPGGDTLLGRKLVLHMDLNSTILVSDSVTKQGTIAALDSFLSTVTWGRVRQGKWEWMCDSPSLLPPCEGAVSYYSQFGRVAGFTKIPAGRRFRGVLEEHLAMLRWPESREEDRDLSVRGEDGRLYHWILPSFFQLLQDLGSQGREFAILFRTFGTDLPRLLGALQKVLAQGCHPLFPDLPALKLSINVVPGQIRCSRRGTSLRRAEEHVSCRDGERSLYQYFSTVQGLGGFQDHFDWWTQNTFSILGGKPLLVDPYDHKVQHVFIDDNILVLMLVFCVGVFGTGGFADPDSLHIRAVRHLPCAEPPAEGHLRPQLLHPVCPDLPGELREELNASGLL
ncbi:hypothetical protein GN956_G5217, partial [Arapaima gigas]